MKKALSCFLILGALGILSSCRNNLIVNNPQITETADAVTFQIDTTNWLTYKNLKYGFEFKYPPEYTLSPNRNISTKEDVSEDLGSQSFILKKTNGKYEDMISFYIVSKEIFEISDQIKEMDKCSGLKKTLQTYEGGSFDLYDGSNCMGNKFTSKAVTDLGKDTLFTLSLSPINKTIFSTFKLRKQQYDPISTNFKNSNTENAMELKMEKINTIDDCIKWSEGQDTLFLNICKDKLVEKIFAQQKQFNMVKYSFCGVDYSIQKITIDPFPDFVKTISEFANKQSNQDLCNEINMSFKGTNIGVLSGTFPYYGADTYKKVSFYKMFDDEIISQPNSGFIFTIDLQNKTILYFPSKLTNGDATLLGKY